MPTYDVRNEVLVAARPEVIWRALIDEFSGTVGWWRPHNTFSPAGNDRADQVGAEILVAVHTRGADRRGLKLRFTARTTVVEPARRLVTEYVAGVLRGTATFVLIPLDNGSSTKLWMHFAAEPVGYLKVLARLKDIGEQHAKATDEAFAHLAARFDRRPATSLAAP